MESQLIESFRLIPYGIYVLAAKQGAELLAMIVSWVAQVSYAPPLLMVALRRNRKALPAIQESGFFSLSLLEKEQKALVLRFKDSPPEPTFHDFWVEAGENTAPSFKGCLASWECRLVTTLETGDHILCIGEVQAALAKEGGEPLTTLSYGKTYIGRS